MQYFLLAGLWVRRANALTGPVPVEGQFGSGETRLWAELLSAKDDKTRVAQP